MILNRINHRLVFSTYKRISKYIPLELKLKIVLLPSYLTMYQANKFRIRKKKCQHLYIIDSPTHSNLGDHAIAYAQRQFIQKSLPNSQIVEIPVQFVDMHLNYIKKKIKPHDIICMIGGGNFGDEYPLHEYSKRNVCAMFPENKVIVFPQTIFYSDSDRGRNTLKETQIALHMHKHLTIAARDRISYERACHLFPNATNILVPDIVLSLPPISMDVPRNGVLCCLRKDLEQNPNYPTHNIPELLRTLGMSVSLTDTCTERGVSFEMRLTSLNAKWREFCSAQVVVTDRLHGMIFAYITSTPCIVIDNYNHKIRDFYETWLKDVNYIMFNTEFNDIPTQIEVLINSASNHLHSNQFSEKYEALRNALLDS